MIHLRPYQLKVEQDTLTASRKGHKQIIIACATGSGKTIIGADITHKANKKKNRVLWLVHREEILIQTIKKLVLFGINPGIIQGKEYMKNAMTHVAMVQTLSRRLDFISKNGLISDIVIADEAHHCCAPSYLKIFEAIKRHKKNCLILGLTATPQRTDGIGLKTAGYTALVQGPQYANLLDPQYTDGDIYLSEPVVFYSSLTFKLSKAKGKKKKNDYDPNEEEKIFTADKIIVNNCINLYNKYFFGAPAIIFCASVNDCMVVTTAMKAAGWRGGAVYDKMDPSERKDYIDGLGDGRYNFLCSYDILGEGVDIPVVAGCICRRRTLSIIIYLQQIGRSARKYPGKKYNIIIDQCGNSIIHGHPLLHRNWTLEGIERKEQEEKIEMTVCTGCNRYLAGKPETCPYCGEKLTSEGFSEKTLKEVPAPMEILPAPVRQGFSDISDIEEFKISDREQAVIDRIKSGHLSDRYRFGELSKMMGKGDKWTNLVWRKYHVNNNR
jgi:superfamily II DNA or RNA helicase